MTAYGVRGANSPAVPFCGQTISGAWPRPSAVARPKSWLTRWLSGSVVTAIWCACRFHHAPVLPTCGTSPTRRRAATRAKKVGRSPACVETARSYRRHKLRTKESVSPAEGRAGMDTTLSMSGLPLRMSSVSRNTSMSSVACGNPRRIVRMSGVVSSTSPRRRSVITRMRGRSGSSKVVIAMSGGADVFGQAFARSVDPGVTYTTSPERRDPKHGDRVHRMRQPRSGPGHLPPGASRRSCLPLGLGRVRRTQHHTAGEADAEHIEPALTEVEQVRVEQRGHNVVGHDQEPEPRNQRAVAKQSEMGEPHRDEHNGADEAELDHHRQELAVRVRGDQRGIGRGRRIASEERRYCPRSMADERRFGDESERFLPVLDP